MNGEINFQGLLSGSIADDNITSYEQLTNKPKINGVELVGDKSTEDLNISYNDLQNKPTLFSGSYNDLSDKPNYNGEVFNGNMYGQKWDTTQDVIIGYSDGQPVYRRTYRNLPFSQYIDLGDVPEWSIFNISGTIETSDEYDAQYENNEVLMIPGYLNNNYWFRIYYMKNGFQYSSSHHPILYFEYASELGTYFTKIPLLYVDYQIKSPR